MKALSIVLFMCMSTAAVSHGGLSSLEGLLEVMVLGAVVMLTGGLWLIISLVLVFKKRVTKNSLKKFRVTMLMACVVLILLVMLILFEPAVMAYAVIFSLILLLLTEVVIIVVRQRHQF